MSITSILKKITGLAALEEKKLRLEAELVAEAEASRTKIRAAEEAAKEKIKADEEAAQLKAAEEKRLVARTPKEIATDRGEAWVDVVRVRIADDDPAAGFFELDWNPLFIKQLIISGYGYESDPEEEIVDRWFRTLAGNMYQDEGVSTSNRNAGLIDIAEVLRKNPA
jgi:hypothetical protein